MSDPTCRWQAHIPRVEGNHRVYATGRSRVSMAGAVSTLLRRRRRALSHSKATPVRCSLHPQSLLVAREFQKVFGFGAWSLLIWEDLCVDHPLLIFHQLELEELIELSCVGSRYSHLLYFERLAAIALQSNEGQPLLANIAPNKLLDGLWGPCLLQRADAITCDALTVLLRNHSIHFREDRELGLGFNTKEAKS